MKRSERRAVVFVRAHPVSQLLRRAAIQAGSVQAPAWVWLRCLNEVADERLLSSRQWPHSPEALGRTFSQLREGLALMGIVLTPRKFRFRGTSSRVWRVETEEKHRQQTAYGKIYLGSALAWGGGETPENEVIWPKSAKRVSSKAENGPHSSAINSHKKMGRTRQLLAVEECQRIMPEEAAQVGAATEEAPVANSHARRLWILCPECGKRKRFLYQRPNAEQWKCFECNGLTTRRRQMKGTNAAFEQWLTPKRWAKMSQKHPACKRLYEAIHNDWQENVAPFGWERASPEFRNELRQKHGSSERVKSIFEQRRWKWSERMERMNRDAGAEIMADLEKWWKWRNRSKRKNKDDGEQDRAREE